MSRPWSLFTAYLRSSKQHRAFSSSVSWRVARFHFTPTPDCLRKYVLSTPQASFKCIETVIRKTWKHRNKHWEKKSKNVAKRLWNVDISFSTVELFLPLFVGSTWSLGRCKICCILYVMSLWPINMDISWCFQGFKYFSLNKSIQSINHS